MSVPSSDPHPRYNFTIPSGLSTKMGVFGTSALAILALVTAVLNGDHTTETITSLVMATLVLITTVYGRMKQAAAVYRDAPSPLQGVLAAVDVVNAPLDPPSGSSPGTNLGP